MPARAKAKLTGEQRLAIKDAQGSSRDIAFQYGISHTEVRRIQKGERLPFPAKRPPKVPKWHSHTSPVGTVVRIGLMRHSDRQYWLKLELSASDAAPIVDQVERAIQEEIAALTGSDAESEYTDQYDVAPDLMAADTRPYQKQDDGSYLLSFKTVKPFPGKKPVRPPLTNAKGGKLRKPERITKGARIAVIYAVVPWHRPYNGTLMQEIESAEWREPNPASQDYTGVGAVLSLRGVTLVESPTKK
jgi:hypothetical protein